MFPLDRGIFEVVNSWGRFGKICRQSRGCVQDNVANFWCAVNVLVKVKRLYPPARLASFSSGAVTVSLLPSLYTLFRRPSNRNFRLCLAISSLSFFLLSFQVHEKSILLVAV